MSLILLDADLAGHLAVALRLYRSALAKRGAAEHPALGELEQAAVEIVRSTQEASRSVTVTDVSDDDSHEHREFLTRRDAARIANVSSATVDRWIRSSALPSTRQGGIRRIARSDLDRFLRAT